MIRPSILFGCLLGSVFAHDLAGQSDKISTRWIRSQPAILVTSYDGHQLLGQPIHAGIDTLYLFASTDLPVGPDWFDALEPIALKDIDRLSVQRGGNRVTRARKSVSYQMPPGRKYYTKAYQEVHKSAVYRDSLVIPPDLQEAFPHSQVLRQAFPQKHLRISVNVGMGGNGVQEDARKALEGSSPLSPMDGYETKRAVQLIDFSWRFLNRIVIGGQMAAQITSNYVYGEYSEEFYYSAYNYDVNFVEHRLYGEYAFFPVDRYFTRRWELMAGAGFLFGKPGWALNYSQSEYSDPDNPVYESGIHEQSGSLYGFQLRSAFHFYIFPGFSLWSGLEANMYPPWSIHQVEVPSNNPSVPFVLQEHTLGFSSVRFKIGASIYL